MTEAPHRGLRDRQNGLQSEGMLQANPTMTDNTTDTALLTAIFDAAVDAIIVSDDQGHITRANKAAQQMFGYTETELMGPNVAMLMPQTMAVRHAKFISDHITTGEKRIIDIGREVEGLRKDGTVFPLHLSVGRATVGGETVFIAILHDLSQRKATEEALSRSQRLDAIGQMTGGIAHDFNNLLTVVIGNLELLQMRVKDDKVGALLNDALEAADLGADLTSRLLVFARNSMLSPEPCNLNEVCAASLSILERTLGANYQIETRFNEDIAKVFVDPTQLQTSIMNIVLNAKDAMGGRGRIRVAERRILQTGPRETLSGEPLVQALAPTAFGQPHPLRRAAEAPGGVERPRGGTLRRRRGSALGSRVAQVSARAVRPGTRRLGRALHPMERPPGRMTAGGRLRLRAAMPGRPPPCPATPRHRRSRCRRRQP